jgi:DHA2 family multidrug resistance protein
VLDSSIANVSIPAIAGDLGASPSQATWVITSFGVANAIAVPLTGWLTQRFGAGAAVDEQRAAVRAGVHAVRPGHVAGDAGGRPRAAGPGGRAADAAVADAADGQLPARPGRPGAGLLGHDHAGGAGGGPAAGRLADRQPQLALDLLHQPAGGPAGGCRGLGRLYRERETPTRRLPIDTIGLALLVLGVGAMQLVLDLGPEADWFESTEIVVLAWWRWSAWPCSSPGS